ncbi:MAG TPA: hypothetical protein VD965_07325 [Burkholderiales bacterium]|nr:hypothetical protein [Burkholderiales bacterium]
MSGGAYLGLVTISMAWLFFLVGLYANWTVFRRQLRRKEGEPVPSGIGPLPGVIGSAAMFFTVPALMKFGVEVPWPWFWILLPLFLDPFCFGWLFLWLFGALTGRR